MAFPSTLTSFTYPTASSKLNNPSHSALENTQSSAIGQLENFIGTQSSAAGTLMYDIRSPLSNGGGHVQTAVLGGTGQTTFTKGDVLVAQSGSVLARLAVSSVQGYALITDSTQATGVKWGVPNNVPTVRVYSSVMTIWNKPSTLSYITVEVQGPGGHGGPAAASSGSSGSGAGAGGYSRKTFAASALPLAASVLGGGHIVSSVGAMSFFGALMTATGGAVGTTGPSSGGIGGVGTGGDINISGQGGDGANAAGASDASGSGGASYFSAGGAGVTRPSNGNDGGQYGGGASGGASSGSAQAGGNGGDGVVIVYEY